MYQFYDQVINKEQLLYQDMKLLYINENFVVDNEIVALLDIQDFKISHGKSLVVHQTKGVFFSERTTKQIMNEFHKTNRVGFMVSRSLANYLKFKQYLPLVHGNVCYMPMSGGSKKSTDWIGLHFVTGFSQRGKTAIFESIQGFKIEMKFPRGNLSDRIHDVSVMTEYFISSTQIYMKSMNLNVTRINKKCILAEFSTCLCSRHGKVPKKYRDIEKGVNHLADSIFLKMCRGELGYMDSVIIYKQKINKLKRNY